MRKLLNTVYITTPSSYLAKENETMVVRSEGEVLGRVPLHALGSIVCFGNVSCSPWLMEECAGRGISIAYLTEHGRFLARVEGRVHGNIHLRRAQFRGCDSREFSAMTARHIVAAKVANARNTLLRLLRDHADRCDADAVSEAVAHKKSIIRRTMRSSDLDEIRGLEGEGARVYFNVFDNLLTVNDPCFRFERRTRRPPLNSINCLLSFVYTLLVHDCRSVLEAVGLDSQAGFLHRDRPGRPSLALDMMEEFRSPLADRLVCTLINRQQLVPNDFEHSLAGGVLLKEQARKTVLSAWQARKQEEIRHPFTGEQVPVGMCFHIQAQLMARYIRGELDAYPAFLWK